MRLHWFSPLPPENTNIANYTLHSIPSLVELADLTVWTSSDSFDPDIRKYCEVRQFRPDNLDWPALNQGFAVYNIGNNAEFHKEVWQVSQVHPGIVVLHDMRLHDFFLGIFRTRMNEFLTHLKNYYGDEAVNNARAFLNGELRSSFMSINYPLTGLALNNALGAIVHTHEGFQELSRMNQWPVTYADLPFPSDHLTPHQITPKGPYRIIVFGFIGGNRCLDSILEALSSPSLRNKYHLDVFGKIWDENFIREMINGYGLRSRVTIHGFVDEKVLEQGLRNADLAINLRNPTMGEASGSQLRIWAYSLPSIVSNIGWYSTIPQGTAAIVRPGYEKVDLTKHLEDFHKQPEKYSSLGLSGFKVVKKLHSPGTYAKRIVEFITHLENQHLIRYSNYFTRRTVSELRNWLGKDSLVDRKSLKGIASAIFSLTSDRE